MSNVLRLHVEVHGLVVRGDAHSEHGHARDRHGVRAAGITVAVHARAAERGSGEEHVDLRVHLAHLARAVGVGVARAHAAGDAAGLAALLSAGGGVGARDVLAGGAVLLDVAAAVANGVSRCVRGTPARARRVLTSGRRRCSSQRRCGPGNHTALAVSQRQPHRRHSRKSPQSGSCRPSPACSRRSRCARCCGRNQSKRTGQHGCLASTARRSATRGSHGNASELHAHSPVERHSR